MSVSPLKKQLTFEQKLWSIKQLEQILKGPPTLIWRALSYKVHTKFGGRRIGGATMRNLMVSFMESFYQQSYFRQIQDAFSEMQPQEE